MTGGAFKSKRRGGVAVGTFCRGLKKHQLRGSPAAGWLYSDCCKVWHRSVCLSVLAAHDVVSITLNCLRLYAGHRSSRYAPCCLASLSHDGSTKMGSPVLSAGALQLCDRFR